MPAIVKEVTMCHLQNRKITNELGAVRALCDNDGHPVSVNETKSKKSFGLICKNPDDVKKAVSILHGSRFQPLFVTPHSLET